ncbi:MAG: nucleotide sugar dehydrogenase [Kiloniellales bacterium]
MTGLQTPSTEHIPAPVRQFLQRIADREAIIGIVGLGYIGLPLVQSVAERGFRVLGFDLDPKKVEMLNKGESYIRHIPSETVRALRRDGRFRATSAPSDLREADAILLCVPTPLSRHREPDISAVVGSSRMLVEFLRPGQLVVLESTTYPGTTDEVVKPILEESGLKAGQDFFLAYSPEREDPGNIHYRTSTIPKVIGADEANSQRVAEALYDAVVTETVPVSSSRTAEAVKITENVFRSVNIALVNELKVIYSAMGVDVWEVIEAAKTKPFGFMPFYPGPGLGGHCIPIDPFYLTWKAREYEIATRFIELAGEVNTAMPHYVVERLARALDEKRGVALSRAKLLVVGLAYKKNVDDTRESPALRLIEMLEERGAKVDYFDPYVPVIPNTREYGHLAGRPTAAWTGETLAGFDAALISTDHDQVDYALLAEHCPLVIDTRNVLERNGLSGDNLLKA